MACLQIENSALYNEIKKLGDIAVNEGLVVPTMKELPKGAKALLERVHENMVAHSVVNSWKNKKGDDIVAVYMITKQDLDVGEDNYFEVIEKDGPPCKIFNISKQTVEN